MCEATFLLPAGIIGNVVGGLIIEKLRLTCGQIIKVLIVFASLTTVNILIMLMIEETGDFAGVTVPYNSRFCLNPINVYILINDKHRVNVQQEPRSSSHHTDSCTTNV